MDMNPRMTPLTQVPGTPAYMPPEALTTPPHYSSRLDCFSHGVLTLQIITRNFPNPGDATTIIEDRRYPTGRISVFIPEHERRKDDIDLVEPSHPLLPITLDCLKDRDTERPSADELCGRLVSLKGEPRYTHSVEQTREHVHILERERAEHLKEIETRGEELRREREEYQICLQKKEEQIQELLMERESRELQLRREREQNHDKDQPIQMVREKVNAIEIDPLRSGRENLPQATNDMVRALHCNSHCIHLHV